MTSSKTAALLIGVASLCLSGCDKIAASSDKNQSSAAAGTAAASTQLDAYISAHNRLIGTFGFYEKAAKYREADVAHASTDGQFLVDAGWIDKGIDELKQARALAGAPADLNAAADALIASMTKVQKHLAELAPYYTSKAYMDDNLARGRKEDAQMLAEIDAADADLKRFSDLIDRESVKRDTAVLEKLKAEGKVLDYNRRLAMFHANALISRFTTAKAPDAALFQRADADLAIIEPAIAAARAEASKAGEKEPPELHFLSSMLGSYRSFKKDHRPFNAEMMLGSYNHAVEAANW
ncbi:DUF3829 domain-containing protein [Sphingomonas sp. 22176]|uniref:DUF3829 domain-containing protein n=1 Tax=Sphingomonas sp. 22176 TaxID=3453884 RepID=UPI003F872DB8